MACADRLSRLARAAVAAAPSAPTPLCVLSSLLLLASPRQLNESRHDDREGAAEPRASRRSRSRRFRGVRRSPVVPRARCRSRRAECADAPTPLCVLSSLLLLASPRQLNESRHDDREGAAEPRVSRRSRSRRLRGVRRSPVVPRARCRSRRAAPRSPTPLCVPSSLLRLASPCHLNESRHDDRESAAEPRASRSSILRRLRGVLRSPVAPRARCRSRRAECADAPLRAQLAAAPCVTAPAQREPTGVQ